MAIETLGAALRQLNRLFADGTVTGLSDAQLLERFRDRADAEAFEALVARHGPMVLSVCRGIVRDPCDAEDAFQATFLVLVKKGGTIRGRGSLGGWLYRVAHRVAIQANAAEARRRRHERQAGQMVVATSTSGPDAPDELLPALHGEIARLPEKYRLAIVLCDLEGMTQAQAAAQLRWSERTIRHRLAEARADSSDDWSAAAWRPTAHPSVHCSCARHGPPCRRTGTRRRSARRWTWSVTRPPPGRSPRRPDWRRGPGGA